MKHMLQTLWQTTISNFTLDTRSIALARILTCIVIIVDLGVYWYWAEPWLAPNGVMPLAEVLVKEPYLQYLFFSESLWFHQVYVLCTALVATAVAFGLRARLLSVVLIVLLTGLQMRAPYAGLSIASRIPLLLLIFLPLAHSFAIRGNKAPKQVVSGATIAITLQILFMYMMASYSKTGAAWLDNTAVYKSLWISGLATDLGVYLRQFSNLTAFLTFATVKIEWYAPLLLIIPIFQPYARYLGIVLLVVMVFGFQLALAINPFTYACMALLAVLLPTSFWQCIQKKSKVTIPRHVAPWYQWVLPVVCVAVLSWPALAKVPGVPTMPDSLLRIVRYSRFEFYWTMFTTEHFFNFWPYFKGVRADSTLVDPWRWYIQLPQNFEYIPQDALVPKLTPGFRWDKYLENMLNAEKHDNNYHKYLLEFLCRKYNTVHQNNPIVTLEYGYGFKEVLGYNFFVDPSIVSVRTIECPD